MRLLRRLFFGLAVLAAALGLLVSLAPWYVQTEGFRAQIEAQGAEAFGRPLTVGGDIALRPSLNPRIIVEDIRVANPAWASRPSLLTARRLELQVDLLALLGGELVILDAVFEGADLLLERRTDGEDNFTFKRGEQVILISDIDNFQLRDTAFAYRSGGETLISVEILDSRSRAVTGEPVHAQGRGRFRGVELDFNILGETPYVPGEPIGAWTLAMRSRSPELDLDVNARVADPVRWKGVTYQIRGQGRATEPLRRLTGVNLPELGEYKVSGSVTLEESGYRLSSLSGEIRRGEGAPAIQISAGEGQAARAADFNLDLKGFVGDRPLAATLQTGPPAVVDAHERSPFRIELRSREHWVLAEGSYGEAEEGLVVSADLQSKGPDLRLWEPWLGRALPQVPFKASTQLRYAEHRYVLETLKAKVGDLSLTGELRYVSQEPRAHLTGNIKIPAIDPGQFLGAGGAGSLDEPIATGWLTTLDSDLKLAADLVSVSGATLRDVKLNSSLEGGRLRLEGIEATVAGSPLIGSAELWSGPQGLAVRGSARGRKLDLQRLLREMKAESKLAGRLGKTTLEFSAQGHTGRELLTSADLMLTVAPSRIEYRHANKTTAPWVVEVDELTAGVAPGGPFTVEAATRLADLPIALTLKGHTLVGAAIGPERWPIRVDLRGRNARLEAQGTAAQLWAGRGFDLQCRLAGERFERAARAVNLIAPFKGPFALTGRLRDQKGQYRFSDLAGQVGQSQFSGDITLDLHDSRPKITADIESQQLYITDYTVAMLEDESEPPEKAAGRVIPDFEIPAEALQAFDLNLTLRVEEWRTPSTTLGGFSSDIDLRGGLLTISESLARGVGGATLSVNSRLDARLSPPYIEVIAKGRNLDYGRMLGHLEVTDLLEGQMDLDFRLSSHGATRDSFLRKAQGHLVLIGGEGKIASRQLDLWAGDLTRVMLSSQWQRKKEAQIKCLVARVDVENGLATAKGLLLDTKDVTVGGSGTLDLSTEALDLVLQPAPREPSLVSLASPARIHGTLAHPQFSRTKLPATRKVTLASGLLAGLVNPAFLVLSLSHVGGGEKNACAAAMEAAKAEFGMAP